MHVHLVQSINRPMCNTWQGRSGMDVSTVAISYPSHRKLDVDGYLLIDVPMSHFQNRHAIDTVVLRTRPDLRQIAQLFAKTMF